MANSCCSLFTSSPSSISCLLAMLALVLAFTSPTFGQQTPPKPQPTGAGIQQAQTIPEKTEDTVQNSVKCYQCNSDAPGQADCAESGEQALPKLQRYIQPCPVLLHGTFAGRDATSCRKVIQNVGDNTTTVRECAYTGEELLENKRRTGNKGIILFLNQCFNTDNSKPCNSAPFFGSGAMVIALAAAVSMLALARDLGGLLL